MSKSFGNRFSPIDPKTVGMITLVDVPDKESLLAKRMALVKQIWAEKDPPFGAVYDVENQEFDPIKIAAEAGISAEVNGLSLINAMGKATSLLYAYGESLDVVGSRYPGGLPRLNKGTPAQEDDERYRYRIWLSSSAFSTAGAPAAYIFHAMTVAPELRDATVTFERVSLNESPTIVVTCLAERSWLFQGAIIYSAAQPDPAAVLQSTSHQPTPEQLSRVRQRLTRRDIGPPSDVMSIRGPDELPVTIDAGVYVYPGNDGETVRAAAEKALGSLIEDRRYLGIDATRLAIDEALASATGLQDRVLDSPGFESLPVPDTAIASYTLKPVRLLGFRS